MEQKILVKKLWSILKKHCEKEGYSDKEPNFRISTKPPAQVIFSNRNCYDVIEEFKQCAIDQFVEGVEEIKILDKKQQGREIVKAVFSGGEWKIIEGSI